MEVRKCNWLYRDFHYRLDVHIRYVEIALDGNLIIGIIGLCLDVTSITFEVLTLTLLKSLKRTILNTLEMYVFLNFLSIGSPQLTYIVNVVTINFFFS